MASSKLTTARNTMDRQSGYNLYTQRQVSGPIRYFVPNNEFRPSRAQTIVAMHDKGMLRRHRMEHEQF